MRISLHKNFEKRFARLDHKIKLAFLKRKDLLVENPFHHMLNNHKLEGGFAGCRSINITGDYSAIFIFRENDHIEFLTIGTHHELYGC